MTSPRALSPSRIVPVFMLTVILVLLIVSALAIVLFHRHQTQAMVRAIGEMGDGLLSTYIAETRDSIEKGQRKSFQQVMDNMAKLDGVVETSLYARYGLMIYRSGEVSVGQPFVRDRQGRFKNPNLALYESSDGMDLRTGWQSFDRTESSAGRRHIAKVGERACADCHYALDERVRFDEAGRAHVLDSDRSHFYYRIPVESRCVACHTHWEIGGQAGILGVSVANAAELRRVADSTWRLLYVLAVIAAVVLAATYAIAVMYRRLAETGRELAEKSGKLAGLLDNSGQGFLSFGRDLLVEPEHSRECVNLLGGQIAGSPVATLLNLGDAERERQLIDNLRSAIDEPDPFRRDLYLSLLPAEQRINGRIVRIAYRPLEERLMLILTDITERRRLEEQVATEQARLKLIVVAVTEADDLFEVLEHFKEFREETLPGLLDDLTASRLAEIYRQVHTFKGLFAQLEFPELPKSLHQLESLLGRAKRQVAAATCGADDITLGMERAQAALESDLAVLRDALGDGFFAKSGCLVLDQDQVAMLDRIAHRLHADGQPSPSPEETREFVRWLRCLRHVRLAEMLSGYPKAVARLAERLGKEVAPVTMEDDGVRVDPAIYGPFAKSLVHLFRNAVDHGIEPPEERLEAGKDEVGSIHCRITREDADILVEIADDGRGLDPDAIRRKAVALEYCDAEQALAMNDDGIHSVIFDDAFSTRDDITETSGRGIGLAAIRDEVDKLGGRIVVASSPGQGTRFTFVLPYAEH